MKMYTVMGVVKDRYVGDYVGEKRNVTQVVMAESEEEAARKFYSYWDKQGTIGYEVWSVLVFEIIE